jgi:hypothetical protein
MGILTPPEFDALTRSDFQIFAERVYAELNPGSTFLDNFHISIIHRQPRGGQARQNHAADYQPSTAQLEVDHRLGRFPRLDTRS